MINVPVAPRRPSNASRSGASMLLEVAAGASAAPHIDESLTAGVYCTQLTDPGTLTEAVAFAVRIEFP